MSASQRFERYMEHLAAGLWPVGGAEDAQDTERRQKAGVPAEVKFATKNEIALQQLETLLAEGAPEVLHAVLCRLRGRPGVSWQQQICHPAGHLAGDTPVAERVGGRLVLETR